MKRLIFFLCFQITVVAISAQTGSFMHDGLLRNYIYYVPTSYDGTQPVPLIINLHGYTSNAAQQQLYTQFEPIADTANFILVYPNGIANAWNSGWNYPYYSGTDDVGFLSALIDTFCTNYNIDTLRIHATGMSNGGFMSFRLACEMSDRIASIASVTGLMSSGQTQNCNPTRPVPVMFIHGTADATVDYNGSTLSISADSTMNYWRIKNGCNSTPIQYNFPDINTNDQSTAVSYLSANCNNNSEVYFIKIINGGHTWPGMYSLPNLVTNQDFNASLAIWNFFKQHPLPGTPIGLSVVKSEKPLVYPNPAPEKLNICFNEKFHCKLFNASGKEILQKSTDTGTEIINTSVLPNGIYLLKITTMSKTYSQKIIICR